MFLARWDQTITKLNADVVIEFPETVRVEKGTNKGGNIKQIAFDNRIKFHTAKFNDTI